LDWLEEGASMGSNGSWLDNENELGRHDSSGAKGGSNLDNDGTLERSRNRTEFTSAARAYRRGWSKKLIDAIFAKRQLSR
jgi:hypothetical protein